jgi:hypothetical protein
LQKSGTKEGCFSIPTEALKAEVKKITTERPLTNGSISFSLL